ncbi:MAG: M28 family peptidase [Paramuribaculum sp.]|nr:M28 family peptidase [Paramuribaculum sp.]
MHQLLPIAVSLLTLMTGISCGSPSRTNAAGNGQSEQSAENIAEFSADSAYSYVAAQVAMGPRVPTTQAHAACAAWIESELSRHGADTVVVQTSTVTDPNTGKPLPIRNIMGRFNPDAFERILLLAHYDTRPTADEEKDPALHNTPIPGANDGGSGVGVLLEIARQLGIHRPDKGVDLLFVDAEDLGISSDAENGSDTEDTWCLGSQYWASNMPYSAATMPDMAIVLDMVGGKGAKFHREQFSDAYASALVNRVWQTAARLGYADRFINSQGGPILDDHLPLLRAGIPTIDIVESRADATGSFPATWHTLSDDITNIDPASLKAAGHTVISLIYSPLPKK